MPKIHVTDTSGETRTIEAEVGISLMENIRNNDFDDLPALCGGCVSCCTCHVHITNADDFTTIEPFDDDEQELLEDSDNYEAAQSRLSCQVEITDDLDGMKVTIQEEA